MAPEQQRHKAFKALLPPSLTKPPRLYHPSFQLGLLWVLPFRW